MHIDKTLGGQIKSFLSTFNKVAVSRMVDFILAPSNKGNILSYFIYLLHDIYSIYI